MTTWRQLTLEAVCLRITDGAHSSPPSVSEGKPMASVKDLTPFGIRLETCRRIPDEDYEMLVRQGCQPVKGDVLIAKDGATALDTVCEVKQNDDVVLLSSVAILRPNLEIIDSSYLHYYLDAETTRSYLKGSFISGAAIPRVVLKDLKRAAVRVPPLPVQRRIAGILSAYDELIENSQRRIRILESMARALYREWFVLFRFPGHERLPRVASPLGEIPKGWEVKTVEEAVKRIAVGKKYDKKTVSATGAVPVFDQGKSGIIGYHDGEPGVLASDVAPVIVFANHTCYQRLIHIPFSAIQNVLPFVPSPSLSRNIYWLHWATNGLIEFNDYKGHWPEFAAKKLVIPPHELCQQFGDFVAPLSIRSLQLERVIENLRRTRDLLLPRLLSGQIELEVN